jgi:hypothetical protein
LPKPPGTLPFFFGRPNFVTWLLAYDFFRFVSGSHEVILFDASYRKVSIESIN